LADEIPVFGVADYGDRKSFGVVERFAHEVGVHYGHAIVGDRDRAFRDHSADLGELFAFQPLGHGTDDVNPASGRRACALADKGRDIRRVVDGMGVGHAGDAG